MDQNKLDVCNVCGKRFASKQSLIRHGKQHSKNKNSYECHLCLKKYSCKRYFDKHFRTAHADERNFECAMCSKKFLRRNVLVNHIRTLHSAEFFECCHCSRNFQKKNNLMRHFRSCRSDPNNQKSTSTINRYTCGVCNRVFDSKAVVNKHYENVHEITLQSEIRTLRSTEEFNEWKSAIQRETVVQFIKQRSKMANSFRHENYVCHRSSINRTDRPKKSNRFPKLRGSKKLHVFCPAEMDVHISRIDGTYVVRYVSTHIGHRVNDCAELRYIYSSEQERLEIAARFKDNETKIEIQEQESLSESHYCTSQPSILSPIDIKYEDLVIDERILRSDDIGVNIFVRNNRESVLYYKEQSMEDSKFGVLKKEDFMLVFMNETQEKYLKRYAKNVICFDETHGTDKYGFFLHVLLVLDFDRVGYPVAFVLTNRNDQAALEIFLQCIKNRAGNIETNVVMTNMRSMYYESWITVMDVPPVFHLYCTRRVNLAWRKKIPAKKESSITEEVKQKLHSLRQELDPVRFEEKLENFLAIDAEDVKEFINYFRQNYMQNTHCWAYAYRQHAGINVNMALETFHKKLRQQLANSENIDWLSRTLELIKEYLEMRVQEEERKKIRGCGNVSSKLLALRRAHHRAEKHCKNTNFDVLVEIDSDTYYVQSFADNNLTYIVSKKDGSKECTRYDDIICGLPCQRCEICFHEYQCSCKDNSISSIMCEHIHAVGIYKRKHNAQVDVLAESFPVIISHANRRQAILEGDIVEMIADTSRSDTMDDDKFQNVLKEACDLLTSDLNSARDLGVNFAYQLVEQFIHPISVAIQERKQQIAKGKLTSNIAKK